MGIFSVYNELPERRHHAVFFKSNDLADFFAIHARRREPYTREAMRSGE